MRKTSVTWLAGVVAWLAISCAPCPEEGTQLVVSGIDWIAQDYADSQGVVLAQYADNLLVASLNLVGGDAALNCGEVYVDLFYWLPTESIAPLDLSSVVISVRVIVPAGFGGPNGAPSGIQVFVKDEDWHAQYGQWRNIGNLRGEYTVTLSPGAASIPGGSTDFGFDPTRIRIIGVKFGINDAADWSFSGPITIQCVNIMPEIAQAAAPDLPADSAAPILDPDSVIAANATSFTVDGVARFFAGTNWRGVEYGQNFGVTPWFPRGNGLSRHREYAAAYLYYARRAGCKVVRVGLIDDGRAAMDEDGYVNGYGDMFRADVETLLDLASAAGCRIEFTLVDFLLAGHAEDVDGVRLRGREEVFENATTREAFITGFLTPFLGEFGAHPALFGFDLCNEPEWIIAKADGGAWEDVEDAAKADVPVSSAAFRAYVDACVAAIRTGAPGRLITVGTSMPFIGLVSELDLDYFAFHHYPWMDPIETYIPLIPAGRPWCLEEFPTRDSAMTLTDYLDAARNGGAAGAWFWNLTPGIDTSTATADDMRAILPELRGWVDAL